MDAEDPGPVTGLRARKKARTRESLEATALALFLERGYDEVRLDDVCAACEVSLRTFFRYFESKEDLVLGSLRAHLDLAEGLFAARPAREPLLDSLHAVIRQVVRDYAGEPDRELTRLRLVAATPALDARLAAVFTGFDQLIRRVAATRRARRPRLVAAAAVAAFRVGLETWVERDAAPDLARLVTTNLDLLTAGFPRAR